MYLVTICGWSSSIAIAIQYLAIHQFTLFACMELNCITFTGDNVHVHILTGVEDNI